ncbi:TonB-dependent receptor [Porticoccaceae bacterium]|nr:TonB-dependent receptor [Porticoccaceae bacterium]
MTSNFRKTKLSAVVSTLVLAPFMASSALAQTSMMDEVIVTATKQSVNAQEIPIAITAIDGGILNDLGIYSSIDLPKVAPGLKVRWQGSFPSFKMRGGGVAGLNGAAVPLYTNGLAGGTSWAGWLDLERAEVLRGPQGTLYGANTLGGLVNIVSKKPSTEGTDYGVAITLGDYGARKVEGFANMPISDTVAVRITGSNTERDPLIENKEFSEGGLRDEDNSYIRAQLSWAPTEAMDINVEYSKWETDSMGNANFGSHYVGLPINPDTGRSSGFFSDNIVPRKAPIDGDVQTGGRTYHNDDPATDPTGYFATTGNFANTWQSESESLTLELNWELEFADLSVKARRSETENLSLWDVDGGSRNIVDGNVGFTANDQIDMYLSSKGDQALRWTIGYYWSDSWDEDDNNGAYVWGYPQDDGTISYPSWTTWDSYGSKSSAVYANAEYDITDDLTASVGIRRQEDSTKSFSYTSNGYGDETVWGPGYTANSGGEVLDASYYTDLNSSDEGLDIGHTDYKLALNYAYNDDINIYGSFSTGYIPSTVSGDTILAPNELDAIELGLKSSWADNTVRLNAALYHSDYTNLSYTVFEECGASICSSQETGGGLTSKGLEVELLWQPVEELNIIAGIIFDNTVLDEFQVTESVFTEGRFVTDASSADGGYYPYRPGGHRGDWLRSDTDAVIATPTYDISGEKASFSPSNIINLDASYRIDLGGNGTIIPGATVYRQSDFKTMNHQYGFANQSGYTTLDLRVTWITPTEGLEIKAFVNNATDELYKVNQNAFSGGRIMADYGRQRIWGVRAGYKF